MIHTLKICHFALLSIFFMIWSFSAHAAGSANTIEVIHDFPYGQDRLQTMDIYRPKNATNAPVIFMVHGGAWRIGDKANNRVFENKVARWVPMGFIFISTNYPMLPDSSVTQQASYVALALATAQKHAATWGGDPTKFILMGHSAGAHLVSLVNADPGLAYKQGAGPWLGTISLDSAAMDVVTVMSNNSHPRIFDQAFGKDKNLWSALSPYHALNARAFPWMGICSAQYSASCAPQSAAFVTKATSLGVRANLIKQDMTHAEVNEELGKSESYTQQVESFMASLDNSVAHMLPSRSTTAEMPEYSRRKENIHQFVPN